ncbi:hypothetical protein Tco_0619461 [Tanacetum coccineum]|uniref:Uncharacterized protein n=1 Tax=Tanacetum coccineum TaxID=301880 RepID=A0ABQ5FFD9_9ASTR
MRRSTERGVTLSHGVTCDECIRDSGNSECRGVGLMKHTVVSYSCEDTIFKRRDTETVCRCVRDSQRLSESATVDERGTGSTASLVTDGLCDCFSAVILRS